ncbi:MAG: Gfo/Idh/MocA family oxidoreductase [Planctomycetota bacterium]
MARNRTRAGIGIVGAGFLAETRARCYARAGGGIVAVVDLVEEVAGRFASRHGISKVCGDLEEMLARDDVDAVDLCVPNFLHRPMAEQAARAGKHVICTKPLTAYVGQYLEEGSADSEISSVDRATMLAVATADARAMTDAARRGGVRLMYGENWIYSPSIVRARRLLAASRGPILEMRGWESHSGSHSPFAKLWRHSGGGALLRLASHPIGAMLHLKREEGLAKAGKPIRPVAVSAEVADLSAVERLDQGAAFVATGWKDVENWGCAVISFEDGSRGVAFGSDNMLGGMESRLEVLSADSHLKCNLSPNNLLQAYAPSDEVFGEQYIMEKTHTSAGWSTPMPDEDWTSGHQAMCEDFLSSLAEDRPPVSDGELGAEVVRVVYAAYLAASEGRRVALD